MFSNMIIPNPKMKGKPTQSQYIVNNTVLDTMFSVQKHNISEQVSIVKSILTVNRHRKTKQYIRKIYTAPMQEPKKTKSHIITPSMKGR